CARRPWLMKNEISALSIVLATLLLTAACAGQGQRVGEATTEPPAVPASGGVIPPPGGTRSLTEDVAPIPGNPPVTMSGARKSVDTKLGTITFEDGRTAMLSKESEVLVPASIDRVRPGIPIVVRNALPVGGKGQRMATVASVDESDQLIELTD